jgi:hypothetical protein
MILVKLWLHLAYLENAPRLLNNLLGLYRVNISTVLRWHIITVAPMRGIYLHLKQFYSAHLFVIH